MRSTIVAAALIIAGAAPALAANQKGILQWHFDLTRQPAQGEVQLWIPYPISDGNQVIRDVKLEGDYAAAAVYTDRVYGTPMLYARWDKGAKSRRLDLSYAVERQKVVRRQFPIREAEWDAKDHALWLKPTSLGPTEGAVKALVDKITAGKATILDKASAVYEWVCENTFRDPNTRGCGEGNVCRLLESPGGKCADIHSVFVALARAAGIPSREVFGIRLGKKDGEDLTGAHHCWAEFYLPGYGWVPVDPGDVRKAMLNEKLSNSDPRTEELRSYFWGGIDAYRVKLAVGRDLVLGPPQAGKPLNYLMYPYAEVNGKPLDWLDPKGFVYSITYRAL